MGLVTLPYTARTTANANNFSDVKDNDQAIIDQVNGSLSAANLASNAVTTAKITDANVTAAKMAVDSVATTNIIAANVTDAKLASPNNSVYKELLSAGAALGGSLPAGTLALGGQNRVQGVNIQPFVSGASMEAGLSAEASATYQTAPTFLYFASADYAVASLTTKLRLRAQVNTNATQPTITFTFGLYPVTFAGGVNTLTVTLGSVVSGSTVAIASPAASSTTQGNSGDFTIPSDGQYALGVVTSGTLTANNASLLTAQLQTRNV